LLPNAFVNIPWATWFNYIEAPKLDVLAILVQPTDLPDTIYLLEGGIRYLIRNQSNFYNYGFNPAAVKLKDHFELQRFPLSATIL
jgi:hypothetical protein